MTKYNPKKIEKKWQKFWSSKKFYEAKDFSNKPKKYILVEFPYPSGDRLHMGHLRPYTAGDVVSRFNRAKGFEVIFPFGWDAFGLPAENYAIKMGVPPEKVTETNIKHAKEQVQAWGMSFDWTREVNTTDPEYYKWTQWIFLQFLKAGLAYEAVAPINWCPKDKTGLANEEVVNGKCERCGTTVEKKNMRQWFLRITDYAEKLLDGLKELNWPEAIKIQQENWIGKSEGAEINFPLESKSKIGNVVLIHGCPIKQEDLIDVRQMDAKHWFPWVAEQLRSKGIKVEVPLMPKPWEAVYEEWKTEIERLNIDEDSILVGHSCGSAFLVRWLGETKKKIRKLVLVGPARINADDFSESMKKFRNFEIDSSISTRVKDIRILVGSNENEERKRSAETYAKIFKAELRVVANAGHFTFDDMGTNEFPELLEVILGDSVNVFTTRPDTLFGATYLVLAPEHNLVGELKPAIKNWKEVESYIEQSKKESDLQRTSLVKEKTGVELEGVWSVNPATKEKIPVWIADYVLSSYGTGAIMAVPAHDERDMEFASKFRLPIVEVIDKSGTLVNSGEFDGMPAELALKRITQKFGMPKVQYKLRDWLFSRQRYWGEPIPVIHCPKCGIVPVPEKDLPVKLPKVKKYEPTGTGESPLAGIDSWVNVKCPKCEGHAERETNTMPQWAGSSWYFLRYADPGNKKEFADKDKLKYWLPIDMYFGGMEHTTLHLLYSRFWNLFLHDQGLVPVKEPYARRIPHGIVLAHDGEKMSKSRGNVVNPDDIVEQFGADTLRMYELFLGPHEQTVSWNDQGIVGVFRFLQRTWAWVLANRDSASSDSEKALLEINRLVKNISTDLEALRFNTCVSGLMEFLNNISGEQVSKDTLEKFLVVLGVFAPHIAEELWEAIGGKGSITEQLWPEFDAAKAEASKVNVVVQVNGKYRGALDLPKDSEQSEVETLAKQIPTVQNAISSREIAKVIFVPNKIINFVIK